MGNNRHNFKFLTENDAIEPNYEQLYYQNFTEFYNRASNIFSYKNLPASIPEYILKKQLLLFGRNFWHKLGNDIIILKGNDGGYRDAYYRKMTTLIDNPYIPISSEFKIEYKDNVISAYDDALKGFECVCMLRNDKSELGLYGLISKYAYLITHAEISLSMASIQSRAMGIASGVGEKAQKELQVFYENLLKGKIYTLRENPIDENTYKVLPFIHETSRTLTELRELRQYYFNEFLNEIGVVTNYNKKQAQQNNVEIEINDKIAYNLVDEMYNTQKEDIDFINEYFGLNIEIVKNYETEEPTEETTEEVTEEETEETDETEEKGVEEDETMDK